MILTVGAEVYIVQNRGGGYSTKLGWGAEIIMKAGSHEGEG